MTSKQNSSSFGIDEKRSAEEKRRAEIANASFLSFDGKAHDIKAPSSTVYRDVSFSESSPFRMGATPFGFPSMNRGLSGYQQQPVYRSVNIGRSLSVGGTDLNANLPSFDSVGKASFLQRSAHKEPQGQPPPPPGGYLEKATTFHTTMKPKTTMNNLTEILKEMEIDYTLRAEKFKLKCEAYPRGVRLPFNVRIFSLEEKYAVEMQRRSGDCVCFSSIHQRFLEKCADRGLCPKVQKRSAVGYQELPLELDSEMLDDSMIPLMKMAESDFTDVKSNAVAAISDMTSDKAVVDWFATQKQHLSLFEKLVLSEVQDVHRPAISCIANLTTSKEICKSIEKSSCLKFLVKRLGSKSPQVVRESSRALENLGNHLGKDVLTSSGVTPSDLYEMLKSSDSRVCAYGNSLREKISAK